MNYLSFGKEMDRLKKVYGERNYPEERVRLLWDEFGKMEEDSFHDGVSRLINENRSFPLIHDFRNVFSGSYTSVRMEKIKEIKSKNDCRLCDNTGSVQVKKNGLNVTRRCSCELGSPGLCLTGDINRITTEDINRITTEDINRITTGDINRITTEDIKKWAANLYKKMGS